MLRVRSLPQFNVEKIWRRSMWPDTGTLAFTWSPEIQAVQSRGDGSVHPEAKTWHDLVLTVVHHPAAARTSAHFNVMVNDRRFYFSRTKLGKS